MRPSLRISCTEPVTKHIVGHTHILIHEAEPIIVWKGAPRGGERFKYKPSKGTLWPRFASMHREILDLSFNVWKT